MPPPPLTSPPPSSREQVHEPTLTLCGATGVLSRPARANRTRVLRSAPVAGWLRNSSSKMYVAVLNVVVTLLHEPISIDVLGADLLRMRIN